MKMRQFDLKKKPSHPDKLLSYLENEAIYILRETARQFERPALLFSGGKDSLLLVHLALKAFRPGKIPFTLMHIDTGHNFEETLLFRDQLMQKIGEPLVVRSVEETIKKGLAQDEHGPFPSRNRQQAITLLEAIKEFRFDAAIGGARRDEEKARSKERFFSFRDEFGAWDPRNQRPELWRILNGKIHEGQNIRVFPLNNWTEVDVWNYLKINQIAVPSLYFAHKRVCVQRPDGSWLAHSKFIHPTPDCKTEEKMVRFRTVGDMTCTAPVFSNASTIDEFLIENDTLPTSERGSRMDDLRSDSAMEDRKKEGYF